MDFNEALQYASQATSIARARKNLLYTFGSTRLPYICLSAAEDEEDQVQIRRGEVTAEPPKIALPGENFSLEGFEADPENDALPYLLIARRINMPPAKYVHRADSTQKRHGSLPELVEKFVQDLERDNDIRTAVISGPDRFWTLSVLLYVGSQVMRSTPANLTEHFEHLRRQQGR